MNLSYLFQDPARDLSFPADNQSLVIPSGDASMNCYILNAAGAGTKPTVITLHGYPGITRHQDLEQALRRTGLNAVSIQYRGAWGSPGFYSFSHIIEDVLSAVRYLTVHAAELRVDPARIFLVGHSMGGFAALNAFAESPSLAGIVMMTPYDLGMMYLQHREDLLDLVDAPDGLRIESGEALLQDAGALAKRASFTAVAPRVCSRNILVIGCSLDDIAPPAQHCLPMLRHMPNAAYLTLEDDHAFNTGRCRMIQAVAGWLNEKLTP